MNKLTPYNQGQSELARITIARQLAAPQQNPDAGFTKETDLGSVKRLARNWPIVAVLIVVFALLGLIISHFVPTVYESDSEVLLQTPGQQTTISTAQQVAALAGFGTGASSGTDIPTQIEVMTSDNALRQIAQQTGFNANPDIARNQIVISPHKTSMSIVLVAVRDSSPSRAQAVGNALVKIYNAHMAQESSSSNGRTILATKSQLTSVAAKLSQSETAYANYSSEVGSIDPTTEGIQKVTRLYSLRTAQMTAEEDLLAATATAQISQKQIESADPTVVPTLILQASPVIQADETKLSDLEQQRYKLSAQYTPQDDEMLQNQKQIDAVKADIQQQSIRESKAANSTFSSISGTTKNQSLPSTPAGYVISTLTRSSNPVRDAAIAKLAIAQADALTAQEQIKALSGALNEANNDIASSPAKYRKLSDLQNDCVVYQKLYDELQAQLVQLDAQLPSNQSYASILQGPSLPNHPVEPRPMLYTAAAGGFGLFFGVILLLLLDYFDPNVRSESDITDLSLVPVLQSLPYPKLGANANDQLSNKSYVRLASTLAYQGLGSTVKTLAITSASPEEGSDRVAANLASALAKGGGKVLLIDATGPVPKIIPFDQAPAVPHSPNSTNGESPAVELTVNSPRLAPLNVSGILQQSDASYLIDQLKEDYDLVIFDAPSVFEGIKTASLIKQVDAVLYVSKVEGATRDEVRQALNLILNGSTPVLGVVLNDARL